MRKITYILMAVFFVTQLTACKNKILKNEDGEIVVVNLEQFEAPEGAENLLLGDRVYVEQEEKDQNPLINPAYLALYDNNQGKFLSYDLEVLDISHDLTAGQSTDLADLCAAGEGSISRYTGNIQLGDEQTAVSIVNVQGQCKVGWNTVSLACFSVSIDGQTQFYRTARGGCEALELVKDLSK